MPVVLITVLASLRDCTEGASLCLVSTESQIAQFTDEGYLVIEDVLDPRSDLDPVVEEYTVIMDRLARELFDAGRISSTCSDLPFAERLTKIQFETGESYHQHFDIALPKRAVAEQTPISVRSGGFSICSATKRCWTWSSRSSGPRSSPTPFNMSG